MKKNKIYLLVLASILSLNSNVTFAEENLPNDGLPIENKISSNDGKTDMQNMLEKNNAIDQDEYLLNYYKEQSVNGKVFLNHSFDIKEPISMYDLSNLNHPYFKENIVKLKENGIEEFAKEMNKGNKQKFRNDSVYNEAVRVGIQSALYKTIYEYNITLNEVKEDLNHIFNFNELLLENGKVIPPVITETGASVQKEDKYTLRTSHGAFFIYKQAEVTIHGLSYLHYVIFDPIKPKTPSPLMLPINDEEKNLWEKGIREGWVLGLRQGSEIIKEGFSTMLRDYVGMQNFHILYKSGIVSYPAIQRLDIGTNFNNETLKIGESTFKIAALPAFNNDVQKWKPLIKIDNFLKEIEKKYED